MKKLLAAAFAFGTGLLPATHARAEEVWIYTSTYKEVLALYEPALKRAFPDIDIRWYQSGSENVASKILTEVRGGRPKGDLVMTSDLFFFNELKKQGALARLPEAAVARLNPAYVDADRRYAITRFPVMVIACSANIPKTECPKSLRDLEDPKWKGRLTMPSPLESGTALTLIMYLREIYGDAYFRKLRENDILASGGNGATLSRIQSGERPVGLVLMENVLQARERGSDVVYFQIPAEGGMAVPSPLALLEGGPHAEAARRVFAWFLSEEAQTILIKGWVYSAYADAPTPAGAPAWKGLHLREWSLPLFQDWTEHRQSVKDVFQQVVMSGRLDGTGASFWWDALYNSVVILLGVSFLAALLAVPAAWLVERTDLPGRTLLTRLMTFPYIVPSILLAVSWTVLANPNVGWINAWAHSLFGIEKFLNIYNLGGVIFIEATVLFPILYLGFQAGLRRMDASLEESARLCGAGPFRIFGAITLPLLRNTLVASLIAIALSSLANFGVPAMIGIPGRIFVLSTGIYSLIKQGSGNAMTEAFWISLWMALGSIGLMVMASLFNKRSSGLVSGKASRPSLVRLGAWKWPLSIGLWGVWALMVALPIVTLILSSFQRQPGPLKFSELGLGKWTYVLTELPNFRSAIFVSLASSGLAAALVLIFALLVALGAWQGQSGRHPLLKNAAKGLDILASSTYSLPGTVIALFLLLFFAKVPSLSLADTIGALVLAYFVKVSLLGLKTVVPAAQLVHPSLLEAAKLSGARFHQRLRYIWVPILRPSLFAAALLVFMPCLSELSMSVLLKGPATENLGVLIFELQEYADRPAAAVVGTLVLIVTAGIYALVGRLDRD